MWANWAGNETSSARVFRPRGTDELAHCVANAEESVRAVGAGHSFAPLVAGTGTIIDVSDLEGPDGYCHINGLEIAGVATSA